MANRLTSKTTPVVVDGSTELKSILIDLQYTAAQHIHSAPADVDATAGAFYPTPLVTPKRPIVNHDTPPVSRRYGPG